jgi:hypothetical protein
VHAIRILAESFSRPFRNRYGNVQGGGYGGQQGGGQW